MFGFKMKSNKNNKSKSGNKVKNTKVVKVDSLKLGTISAMGRIFEEMRFSKCVFSKVIITIKLDNGKELSYSFIDSFTSFDEEYMYYSVLDRKKYKKLELKIRYYSKGCNCLKEKIYVFTERESNKV